jgi:hypothetical protein
MATLIVTSGPRAGERIDVTAEMVVGRENADLEIADPEISRRHARIRLVADGLEVEDLGSTNGTWVDGARIDAAASVGDGAKLRFGDSELSVEIPAPVVDAGATVLRERPTGLGETTVRPIPSPPSPTAVGRRPEPAPEPEPEPEPVLAPPPPPDPEPEPAPIAPLPAPALSPQPVAAGIAQPFGALAPRAASRRRKGVATRLWGPTVIVMATIGGTAVALIVYFAGR